jgi:hypothetical protein
LVAQFWSKFGAERAERESKYQESKGKNSRKKVKNEGLFWLKMESGQFKLGAGQRGIRGFRVKSGRVGRWVGRRFLGGVADVELC